MAWDPTTFPWDWDAESFHIAGHGSGNDLRKVAGNGRLLETELCVGKNGVSLHTSKELGPIVPTTGTSSLAKHDASHIDWHASRHMNGFSRELGPATPTACPTSLSRHDELNVSWHGSLHINGSAMANTHSVLPSNGMAGHGDVSCMATGVLPIVTTCIGSGSGPFSSCNNNTAAHSPGKAVQKGVVDNWKKTEYGIVGAFEQDRQQQPSVMQHAHQQMILSKEKTQLAAIKVKEEKNIASTSNGARAHHIDEQHSSNATGSAGSGDSFTGLHLGKRTYSPDVLKATSNKSAQKPVLAPKKARTGVAIPRCQVEGCKLDLTSAKDYHRRHKVCELHSKAEKVVVASAEQRFCQQCSRFHALAEFDEAKRSCRRRLAGHNERRRKPQPDPLALHRLHSAYEDWSFLHQPRFSRMPLLWQEAGDYRSGGMWPRAATTALFDSNPACDYTIQGPATERQGYMKSLSQPALSYHDKLSLLLLQSPKSVMPNSTAYPRVHHQYPFDALGGPMGDSLTLATSSTGVGVLPGLDITPVTRGVTRVSDSGRALSLLSLQTRGSQAPDVLMPDPPGLANLLTLNHQLAHNEDAITPQQFLLHGGQQYYHDVSVDKNMVSMALSSSQAQSSGAHLGSMVTFERDLDECSFAHDLNRQASTHPLFALMPYPQEDGLSQGGQHEGAAG